MTIFGDSYGEKTEGGYFTTKLVSKTTILVSLIIVS